MGRDNHVKVRVVTSPPSSSAIGRAGEFLTAASLESMGWRVSLSSVEHIDLLAISTTRILRVQVKSTAQRNSRNHYAFTLRSTTARANIQAAEVDIVALAMLDTRQVFYLPAAGLPKCIVLNKTQLNTVDLERTSWASAIDPLSGGYYNGDS